MRQRHRWMIWGAFAIAAGAALPFLSPRQWGFHEVAWAASVAATSASPAKAAATAEEPPYPHGKFRADCALCHRPEAWKPARISNQFDHERYGFALRGAHQAVSCRQCHASLDFATASTACSDCHADVHQGEFGTDCSRCHGTRSFIDRGDQERMHRLTRFPLAGAHATVDCESCHALQSGGALSYVKTPTQCDACHMDDFTAAKSPDHVAGGFSHECSTCHSDVAWSRTSFDHSATNFPLTGVHAATTCNACHTGETYTGLSTQCVSCHQPDYNATSNPPHQSAGLPTTCENCHTTAKWGGGNFDHASTAFPLTGAHVTTQCLTCHTNGIYTGLSTLCKDCHQADFNETTNPNHVQSGFPTTCEDCHGTAAWDGAQFDHSTTGFALTGAHTGAQCLDCHVGGNFTNTSPLCVSCHQADYNGTSDPNHQQAGFATTCQDCHTTTGWDGASFNHNTATSFPLTGAHTAATCQSCHGSGVFNGLSTLCKDCHQADFNGTTNPNHVQSGFPTTCEDCHGTAAWDGAQFDHATTGFALTGAHTSAQCLDCHVGGNFTNTSPLCVSCHQADYNGTSDPNHQQAGFATTCQDCHTTTGWDGASFNHNTATSFPLTGAHTAATCQSCHGSGVFNGLSTLCKDCHQADFNGTTNPNHVQSGFPTTCEDCHGTAAWDGAQFDHATTGFALTGAHTSAQCLDCHVGGNFTNTSPLCVSCHQADYNGTSDPNHQQAGFATTCQDCHTTTRWDGASFNHNTATSFPLTGAHTAATCQSCHGSGVFNGLSTLCKDCHQADFNGTTNPNHVQSGFPTTCEDCHGTAAWDGAQFDHSTTGFALTGAHTSAQCLDCHVGGNFNNTSPLCVSCHQTDFNGTTNPAHQAAGFPTTCQDCHSTITWTGATFDHDSQWFPIYSGRHRGEWDQCSDCHMVANNFSSFNCLNCHPHNDKTQTDNDHRGRSGYSYESSACYDCHPRGNS